MSDATHPRKNDLLIRVRKELSKCPKCGLTFDRVDANSHQTTPDPETWRIYFLFAHGKKECVDFTTGREFDGWIAKAQARS